jgi:hypothetical protein
MRARHIEVEREGPDVAKAGDRDVVQPRRLQRVGKPGAIAAVVMCGLAKIDVHGALLSR